MRTISHHLNQWRDPCHLVLSLNWPWFFGALLVVFELVNLLFGTLYWLLQGSVASAAGHIFPLFKGAYIFSGNCPVKFELSLPPLIRVGERSRSHIYVRLRTE